MDDTTTYTIRVPKDLKTAFEKAAKGLDRNGSQILRDHMREFVKWYMKEHAQGDLLSPKKGKK
jgi:predicted transcriptional regulator